MMKIALQQIRIKKVLSFCLLLLPLIFLTGCSQLLTAESITNLMKKGAGAATGLGVLGTIVESTSQCWACSVFIIAWNAIGEAFNGLYEVMSKIARLLLGVGLLFWLTFTIGKMVCQLKEPNMKDYIPKIAGILFKSIIVGIALSAPAHTKNILTIFVEPIMECTIYISKLVLPNDLDVESTILSVLSLFSFPSVTIAGFLDDSISNYPVFTKDIGESLKEVIYNLYDTFKGGFALGAKMMFQIDPMGVASGGLILATFFYFMFYFPLLLIEGFAALGVVLILFPIFMAGWVFPATKNYLGEAIKVIFQSVAQILVTCIYISVIIAILNANQNMFSPTRLLTDPALVDAVSNLNNNGLAFFAMVFCLLKLTNDIPNITSYFVGEMNKSIIARNFSKMQKLMASGAKMMVGSAMASTGVLAGVGHALAAQGSREAIGTSTDVSANDAQAISQNAEIREQTRSN